MPHLKIMGYSSFSPLWNFAVRGGHNNCNRVRPPHLRQWLHVRICDICHFCLPRPQFLQLVSMLLGPLPMHVALPLHLEETSTEVPKPWSMFWVFSSLLCSEHIFSARYVPRRDALLVWREILGVSIAYGNLYMPIIGGYNGLGM